MHALTFGALDATDGRMLSIGKLVAGQEAYYETQAAKGRDDYYSGRGEAAGAWTGSGAARLGLAGDVDAEGFSALLAGRDPSSPRSMRGHRGNQRVAGYDLTFSAPKSASILFVIGDRATSRALVEAHEESLAAALDYVEREAVQVRRGHDGRTKRRGRGLVAAAYRHRMSRAEDPQLHTHVVTANMMEGEDGRWSACTATRSTSMRRRPGRCMSHTCEPPFRERLPWVEGGPSPTA
jgi:conjugative relaxase-like TrwC/TraI family protein